MTADQNTGHGKRYYFHRRQFVLMAVGFTCAALLIYFLGILTGVKMGSKLLVTSSSPPTKVSPQPFEERPESSPAARADRELQPQDGVSKSPSAQPSAKEPAPDMGVAEQISGKGKESVPSPAKEAPSAPTKNQDQAVSSQTAPQALGQKKAAAPEPDIRKESGYIWTVQVQAFPDESSADVLVTALKAKGYDAYRIMVNVRGKIWHRVRAGRFANRNEAEQLRMTLTAKEGLKDAFLAREETTKSGDS